MKSAPLLVLVLASAALAQRYQPGTQPRTWPSALLAADNQLPVTLELERASYCTECHDFDLPGPTATSPGSSWKGTMMANAARDPLMYAALAIANQDVPGIGGDYCLRCHSPSGFLHGHTMPNTLGGSASNYPCDNFQVNSLTGCIDYCQETPAHIANGYCIVAFPDRAAAQSAFTGHPFDPRGHHQEPNEQRVVTTDGGVPHDPYDDAEGITCAVCHRMQNPAEPSPYPNQSGGNYLLRTDSQQLAGWLTPRSVRAGPYATVYSWCTNPNDTTTCNPPGSPHAHPAAGSAFHTRSDFCGQCHDVTNPTLNRLSQAGADLGFKMPIERTFSEWRASSYGRAADPAFKTCQGCHMPNTNSGLVCTPSQQPPSRAQVPQHEFTGGNWWIPTVFANPSPSDPQWLQDLVASVDRQGAYLAVAQAAMATLGRAAQLDVRGAPAQIQSGSSFGFSVRITNLTGHKLPTGYPEGRRMWLQVIAQVPAQRLPAANPFFQSGAYDDTSGVLTKDAQIKVYEVELSTAGRTAAPSPPEFHFAANQIVWKDNRIPPAGFDPATPGFAEMQPVGATYPLDSSGHLVSFDDTTYTVPVPAFATGDVQLVVRLVYQTTSKEYIDFLRTANTTNPRGSDMTQVWQNHGRGPFVVMAQKMITLPNARPCVPTPETCDGADHNCDGVPYPPACLADMSASPTDGGADGGTGRSKPSGCGVSVVGADWKDLTPLAALAVFALLYFVRRRRA